MHQPNAESRLSFMKAIVGRRLDSSKALTHLHIVGAAQTETGVGRYGHLAMQAAKEGASRTRWGITRQSAAVRSSCEWPALVDSNILKRRPVRVP